MEKAYLYPGVFCPPTKGHLHILKKACDIFPEVYVVCSQNPNKDKSWFSPKTCVDLWNKLDLPNNCALYTFEHAQELFKYFDIVLIRGLRKTDLLDDEFRFIQDAHKDFSVSHFHYILSDEEYDNVSSTVVRETIEKLEKILGRKLFNEIMYQRTKNG